MIKKLLDKIRRGTLTYGYACDICGDEMFDYPARRVCERCEGKLHPVTAPCPKCGRQRISDGVCLDCKAMLPRFTQGFSAFLYEGEGAAQINRLKGGYPRIAAYFGERVAEAFLRAELLEEGEAPLVVAVPTTASRKRERGYNQAELLAEGVETRLKAEGIAAELRFDALEKRKDTRQQKHMTRRERTENVKGAFFLRERKLCKGRVILLVDDILTTGATGSECAERLLNAGAKAVYFLTATSLREPK